VEIAITGFRMTAENVKHHRIRLSTRCEGA